MEGAATGEVDKRGRDPGRALPHRLVAELGKGVDQVFGVGMKWLYQKKTTVRLDRERAERRQKKEEEAARREEAQPALFDF